MYITEFLSIIWHSKAHGDKTGSANNCTIDFKKEHNEIAPNYIAIMTEIDVVGGAEVVFTS